MLIPFRGKREIYSQKWELYNKMANLTLSIETIYNYDDMNVSSSKYLMQLGWDSFFEKEFQLTGLADSIPARIASESKGSYQVYSQYGELTAKISGRLRYRAGTEKQYPAVGDWVVVKPKIEERKCIIQALLPRKSKFSRKVAGELTEEQIVSANVDTVFIVNGLDGGRNFNLRRIERYLALAWSSGAVPVIILNKLDLCPDVDTFIRNVEAIAPGVFVHPVSAKKRIGLDMLKNYLIE
ncbi:MAG: GTPase RsgA, partial [Dehalococcoidales bacterium]|nr:GTPase RsgA [Dehalococcoidales bacterium]